MRPVLHSYTGTLRELGIGPRRIRMDHYLLRLLTNLQLDGRSVLDIGGGGGVLSFAAAHAGASRVVCLEPGAAGSSSRAADEFAGLQRRFPDLPVRLDTRPFQEFEPDAPFDVVLLHNSINHLDEAACVDLRRSAEAREAYLTLFRRIARISAPGATLLISDCSPSNAFGMLGLRNPLAPTIEWHKHQPPSVWAALASEAGFGDPATYWSTFHPLAWPLLANSVGAFLTFSHFSLRLRRR